MCAANPFVQFRSARVRSRLQALAYGWRWFAAPIAGPLGFVRARGRMRAQGPARHRSGSFARALVNNSRRCAAPIAEPLGLRVHAGGRVAMDPLGFARAFFAAAAVRATAQRPARAGTERCSRPGRAGPPGPWRSCAFAAGDSGRTDLRHVGVAAGDGSR